MELPSEKFEKYDDDKPRMMGDISLASIIVCLVILGMALINRYLSLY